MYTKLCSLALALLFGFGGAHFTESTTVSSEPLEPTPAPAVVSETPAPEPSPFVRSRGCYDPNCTNTTHYHGCEETCTISSHHHSCTADTCYQATSHHAQNRHHH